LKRVGGSKLLWGLGVALAFGMGWMVAGGEFAPRDRETLPPKGSELDPAAVMVTVAPATFRPVQRKIEAVGTLHGFEEVVISAKVEGRVRAIHHEVADEVKPGEVLVEIDPTDYELAVQQAERALAVELAKLGLKEPPGAEIDLDKVPPVVQAQVHMENAHSHYDRMRRLALSHAISAEERDTAISDFRAAQAEYDNQVLQAQAGLAMIQLKQSSLAVARQQLKDTQIRVPTPSLPIPGSAAGVRYAITRRAVADGTLVRPGTELFKLVIDQALKLRVPVPERYSAEVRVGQEVEVSTASSPQPFLGKVIRINPAVEPTTRTFEVEILVPNADGARKPGSFAKAAILTQLDSEAVTVPLTAVVRFAGVTKIFVAENGRAKTVPVTLGVQTTEWVEIAQPPLPHGTTVITSGQTALADNSPIAIRSPR
jgi:RND family efflux transporter MFP subunit